MSKRGNNPKNNCQGGHGRNQRLDSRQQQPHRWQQQQPPPQNLIPPLMSVGNPQMMMQGAPNQMTMFASQYAGGGYQQQGYHQPGHVQPDFSNPPPSGPQQGMFTRRNTNPQISHLYSTPGPVAGQLYGYPGGYIAQERQGTVYFNLGPTQQAVHVLSQPQHMLEYSPQPQQQRLPVPLQPPNLINFENEMIDTREVTRENMKSMINERTTVNDNDWKSAFSNMEELQSGVSNLQTKINNTKKALDAIAVAVTETGDELVRTSENVELVTKKFKNAWITSKQLQENMAYTLDNPSVFLQKNQNRSPHQQAIVPSEQSDNTESRLGVGRPVQPEPAANNLLAVGVDPSVQPADQHKPAATPALTAQVVEPAPPVQVALPVSQDPVASASATKVSQVAPPALAAQPVRADQKVPAVSPVPVSQVMQPALPVQVVGPALVPPLASSTQNAPPSSVSPTTQPAPATEPSSRIPATQEPLPIPPVLETSELLTAQESLEAPDTFAAAARRGQSALPEPQQRSQRTQRITTGKGGSQTPSGNSGKNATRQARITQTESPSHRSRGRGFPAAPGKQGKRSTLQGTRTSPPTVEASLQIVLETVAATADAPPAPVVTVVQEYSTEEKVLPKHDAPATVPETIAPALSVSVTQNVPKLRQDTPVKATAPTVQKAPLTRKETFPTEQEEQIVNTKDESSGRKSIAKENSSLDNTDQFPDSFSVFQPVSANVVELTKKQKKALKKAEAGNAGKTPSRPAAKDDRTDLEKALSNEMFRMNVNVVIYLKDQTFIRKENLDEHQPCCETYSLEWLTRDNFQLLPLNVIDKFLDNASKPLEIDVLDDIKEALLKHRKAIFYQTMKPYHQCSLKVTLEDITRILNKDDMNSDRYVNFVLDYLYISRWKNIERYVQRQSNLHEAGEDAKEEEEEEVFPIEIEIGEARKKNKKECMSYFELPFFQQRLKHYQDHSTNLKHTAAIALFYEFFAKKSKSWNSEQKLSYNGYRIFNFDFYFLSQQLKSNPRTFIPKEAAYCKLFFEQLPAP